MTAMENTMENKDSGKSAKSHGLGRGLSALLGSDAVDRCGKDPGPARSSH
jgi:hypothetical protein